MELLIPLLASVMLLLISGALLSTLGRRRRRRPQPLPEAERLALADVVGEGLAGLVAAAVPLRQEIEAVARIGREMQMVERHLGRAPRRPLWRQIEDANYGHELGSLARVTASWLARAEALPAMDKQVLERLGLELEAVYLLRTTLDEVWATSEAGLAALRSRSSELDAVQDRLDAALACLLRVERELASYRGGGYR